MTRLHSPVLLGWLLLVLISGSMTSFAAPTVQLLLPLGRANYQTNEQIGLTIIRNDTADALAATDLDIKMTGDDGSKLAFTFPVPAIAPHQWGWRNGFRSSSSQRSLAASRTLYH